MLLACIGEQKNNHNSRGIQAIEIYSLFCFFGAFFYVGSGLEDTLAGCVWHLAWDITVVTKEGACYM